MSARRHHRLRNISNIYLKNTAQLPGLKLIACADLVMERAEAKAQEHGIRAMTVEDLIASPTST